MRVLLVNDLTPAPGKGAETHLSRLAAGLEAEGDAVGWFAGEVVHGRWTKALDFWDPGARRSLARRVELFEPDVINFHNVLNELSAAVFGAAPTVPSVLTVHDIRLAGLMTGASPLGPSGLRDRAQVVRHGLARRAARRHMDAVIGVSEHLSGRLRAAGFERVHTIPPLACGPISEPGPVGDDIVFAGQLVPEKGIHVLIEAFGIAVRAGAPGRLRIAGGGPAEPDLRELAGSHAPGRVDFEGTLDDRRMSELWRHARAVCAPSLIPEASPLVLTEAALHGRAAIASDGPAQRERIGEYAGILVPPGDVAALAAALDRLLRSPAEAEAMGRAAAARAAAHAAPFGVAATRQVYAEAMARCGRGVAAGSTG